MFTRKTVNLVIEDYAVRMADHSGGDLKNIKRLQEKAIPDGLIEHGRILNEMDFYDFIRNLVKEWGIRRRQVQFYVPDSLVIMRKVEYPAYLKADEINGYFQMELGHTLYLPFDDPYFDVFPLPESEQVSMREGLLFAVPEGEIKKYRDVFIDAGLKPITADIRSLGVYRYFYSVTKINPSDVYLFFEVNLNYVVVSIFTGDIPEFLRFHDLDIRLADWHGEEKNGLLVWTYKGDESEYLGFIQDQITELERILNFYRYSIHRGDKSVTQIVLLGDFPHLELICEQLQKRSQIPLTLLKTGVYGDQKTSGAYIPALGLALRGK